MQEISDVYSLPVSTILARMDQGVSLREAISRPRWSFTPVTVKGTDYPSIASAARALGLNPGTVRSRLIGGWPIEEAFEIVKHKKKIKNHNNKGKPVCVNNVCYTSIKQAAIAHGFDPRFIANRVRKGLTVSQALELSPFPDWFVPGKGQKQAQIGRRIKQERESIEGRTGLRKCSCCGELKPISDYHGKSTPSSRCRNCISASFLRYKYNISLSDFMALKEAQGGKCKICECTLEIDEGSSLRTSKVAVDHCHQTGTVRGLLCSKCNQGLGFFRDSADLLRLAAAYLENTKQPE
jgi:hypothetical protein